MKIRHLLLSTLCALSLNGFAQEGKLLFYESFEGGVPSADSYSYDIDCKIDGGFYIQAPTTGTIGLDNFVHHPVTPGPETCESCRWDYPNNSLGNVWRPHLTNTPEEERSFEFKLTTKDVPFAYISLATLWYGSYYLYYRFNESDDYIAFDNGLGYTEQGPKYDVQEALKGWWFDRKTENLGGQDEVHILVVQRTGTPYMMDDIQITGYTENVIYKGQLTNNLNSANSFYSANGENDETYCPTKIIGLPPAIEAAQAVADNENATQVEINDVTVALRTALNLAREVRDDFFNEELDPVADQAKYDEMMDRLEAFDAAREAFDDAMDAMEAAEKEIENLETLGLKGYIPEATLQEFEAILAEAKAMDDLCYTILIENLTEQMEEIALTMETIAQNIISVDGAEEAAFAVFPNPADDAIRVAGVAGGNLYIFDAAGKQMLSIANYQGDAINIGSFAAGTYTVAYGGKAISFIKK